MAVCTVCLNAHFKCLLRAHTACSNGDVRLIGGAVETEGTVEVCLRSVWGVIQSAGWTHRDANVVCKQLGYSSGGMYS